MISEVILYSLGVVFEPHRFLIMMCGIMVGIVFGVIPGLGAIFSVAILLCFIHKFEMDVALVLIMGALGVVNTAHSTSSILIGVPGSAASIPTAIEGFPMTQRGEAAHALSAAYLSSMIGGVLGAFGLMFLIPIARPLALFFGSPELFMACMLGIIVSGAILGKNFEKGLISGLLGLLLGTVGATPSAAQWRYTFGSIYLMDGVSMIILAVGLYGLAEVVSLLIKGGSVAERQPIGTGWIQGIHSVISNWSLVLRGTLIGMFAGILPALGGIAGTLMAYAQTIATSKDKSKFGKGDVRGIICPEASANSVHAGSVIPTMFFSVPGSVAMAMLMGVMISYGYYPGPRFVVDHLDLLYIIVWTLVVSNIIGAGLCFFMTPLLSRLTYIPFLLLAPALFLGINIGAYQTTRDMSDLIVLFIFGLLGWIMKETDWPRAPFLIGFVLAIPVERYYFLTVKLYPSYSWLLKPGVIIIGLFIIISIFQTYRKRTKEKNTKTKVKQSKKIKSIYKNSDKKEWYPSLSTILNVALCVVFGYAVLEASNFHPNARLVPWLVSIPGFIFAIIVTIQEIRVRPIPIGEDYDNLDLSQTIDIKELHHRYVYGVLTFLGIALYYFAISIIGFRVASVILMMILLLGIARKKLLFVVLYIGGVFVFIEYVGGVLMNIKWPVGWLGF